MKIAIVSHLKYAIRSPYAGGLEMFTHGLVQRLARRGHDVRWFASGDSDSTLPLTAVCERGTIEMGRAIPEADRDRWIEEQEDQAYAGLVGWLGRESFDVIHNNSLHPTPLAAAAEFGAPMVTTLHTPPLERLCAALKGNPTIDEQTFVNVSVQNAKPWTEHIPHQRVIHNGVDIERWTASTAKPQRRAIWFGRITPEKGTHLAIEAARKAGLRLLIVGPKSDATYFEQSIRPLLSSRVCYGGHADHQQLHRAVRDSAVTVLTPRWDEPFGLVAAESLACGTPVATFARGGLKEVVDRKTGALCTPECTDSLAEGLRNCLDLDRRDCRSRAVHEFSIEANISSYENLYEELRHRHSDRDGASTHPATTPTATP